MSTRGRNRILIPDRDTSGYQCRILINIMSQGPSYISTRGVVWGLTYFYPKRNHFC